MRIDWTPSLQTGVEEVDRYQRDVFAAFERVARATTAPDVVLESALRRLLDAASTQFAAEERWLQDAGDPALVRHELEHRRLLTDVAAAAEQLARGERAAVDALDLTAFVSGWLAAHVADCDRELARAARAVAGSPPEGRPGRASA
jgi:hemerythrin-like metal-binding protein